MDDRRDDEDQARTQLVYLTLSSVATCPRCAACRSIAAECIVELEQLIIRTDRRLAAATVAVEAPIGNVP